MQFSSTKMRVSSNYTPHFHYSGQTLCAWWFVRSAQGEHWFISSCIRTARSIPHVICPWSWSDYLLYSKNYCSRSKKYSSSSHAHNKTHKHHKQTKWAVNALPSVAMASIALATSATAPTFSSVAHYEFAAGSRHWDHWDGARPG